MRTGKAVAIIEPASTGILYIRPRITPYFVPENLGNESGKREERANTPKYIIGISSPEVQHGTHIILLVFLRYCMRRCPQPPPANAVPDIEHLSPDCDGT